MDSAAVVCVCGAGTMGSGIAQLCAQAGFSTLLFDISEPMLDTGKQHITGNLDKLVAKGKLTAAAAAAITGRIRFTSRITECIADLVIEAIVEKKEAKTDLFTRLAQINTPQTIFATNTSSIAIAAIAAGVPGEERVLGMHFFNPAPLMKLVEIIRGPKTSDTVVQSVTGLAAMLGKTAVVCKDGPGFIVNRVARPYYLEAMRLVEQGHTTIEQADRLLEATGFKMGPFKLMDLIGMDVNYSVSNIVWNALHQPARLQPSALQQQKVAAGELGRKTGKGFYQY
ncbi:3-hydroxyacyl-CoA dehydrogenase family protein [Deminuibacter soli]|uniref:3-hydroxybutyryl-CoA dehydrogenase n=1 Tax=Deminuibacter soli TaxID=2291815 RepID=A0A3E1NRP4_9BACT|nr:3-hydroxyacyl-CoA dehydrogenase NAD-binding domain-containing protein [Deminuibacter soli]RFM30514.1 3-hydroxybutyryl-CoA dehydrogenase [Deminuibacter soli]